MRLERDTDELDRMGIAGVAAAREPLDLERDRPTLGDRALAVKRADLAPDHHADDRVDGDVGDLSGADVAAVAQHGEPVAEPEHFLEPVGDEDDRQALGLERGHDAGEIGDLGLAQRRGGLVHDYEPRAHRERPGDLDQLLLGDRKIADRRHRVAPEPDLVGDRAGVLGEAPPADEQPRAGFAADEHILGDRHVGGEGEFLIDGDDAGALGVVGRSEGDRLAIELDLA